jgi:hypothetical protein
MLPDYLQKLKKRGITDLPIENSIGLFSVGFDPIPGSFGAKDEAIDSAVNRLRTKFKLLLAARLLKLTLNASSSRLNIVASLTIADSNKALLAQSFTVRGEQNSSQKNLNIINSTTDSLAKIEIDKPVQISVENREKRDLYMGVLIFSPDGDIDIIFPLSEDKNAALIRSGQSLQIPNNTQIQAGIKLSFGKPLGMAEVLIVASTAPIDKALKPLQALAKEQRSQTRSISLVAEKAEDAIASLLDDLASGTRGTNQPSPDVRLFDTKTMAALSMSFEIVEHSIS